MNKWIISTVLCITMGIVGMVQVQAQTNIGGSDTNTGVGTVIDPGKIDIEAVKLKNPLGTGTTLEGLLERIVRFLRDISVPIEAGMVIFGAYQILFAAGDPEKIKVGRRTILYAVIGYVIIWIGWGITTIIEEVVG